MSHATRYSAPDRDRTTNPVTQLDTDEAIRVGIGEYVVAEGNVVLVTQGLGSCVGLGLYDDQGVAGLAHVLLPTRNDAGTGSGAKYADVGVARLVRSIEASGVDSSMLQASLAGGGSMIAGSSIGADVGEQNVEAVRAALDRLGIPIRKADVGDHCVRKITLDVTASEGTTVTIERTTQASLSS